MEIIGFNACWLIRKVTYELIIFGLELFFSCFCFVPTTGEVEVVRLAGACCRPASPPHRRPLPRNQCMLSRQTVYSATATQPALAAPKPVWRSTGGCIKPNIVASGQQWPRTGWRPAHQSPSWNAVRKDQCFRQVSRDAWRELKIVLLG